MAYILVESGCQDNGEHQEAEADECPDRSRPYIYIGIQDEQIYQYIINR